MKNPLRVLVADDDPLNLRVAARHLKALGHTGALVTDGLQVLRILEQQTFDLLLLDLSMPNMCGSETLRTLRQREQGAHHKLPVFVLSGYDDTATRQRLAAEGADGFLPKPLSVEALEAVFRQIFPR